MHKKAILLILGLLLVGLQATCIAGERAAYRVTQFHYTTLRDTLYIEVGLDKASADFSLHFNAENPQQLILDLKRTNLGSIKKSIAVDGEIAQKIEFKRLNKANGQMIVTLPVPAAEARYKIYTLPADRKANKPFRLVLAIKGAQAASAFAVEGVAGKTIVIDPGHGGSDSGAVGPTGVMEKNVTLAVAQRVESILAESGAKVVMSRTADGDVYGPNATDRQELQARVDVGNRSPGADLFLSIHANAFSSPKANGTETFYYGKSAKGAGLAAALQQGMVEYGGLYDRGTDAANFYVVKYTTMPAALVEMAFISNPAEEALLASEDFQEKIARGICRGLSIFFAEAGI